jgi:hypothetical protein
MGLSEQIKDICQSIDDDCCHCSLNIYFKDNAYKKRETLFLSPTKSCRRNLKESQSADTKNKIKWTG